MRIYLAAAYERHDEMCGIRDILAASGHTVMSRWIDRAADVPAGTTANLAADPASFAQYAIEDLDDMNSAGTMISFTGGGRGGRHVEFGYALATSKNLVVTGPREHVFHTLADEWYPDWEHLMLAWSQPGRPLNKLTGTSAATNYAQTALRDLLRKENAQDDPEHPHGYWEAGDYP